MKIIHCCLQGMKHKERNQPCEDNYFFLSENGVTSASVADGAGSDKYPDAKIGSEIVSNTVCRLMVSHFDELFEMVNEFEARRVVEMVCKRALTKAAEERGMSSYETMASTLLCVATKENLGIAVQIGDGIVGRCIGESFEALTFPQNGEYASSTYFITHPEAYQFIQVKRFFTDKTSHLFLMSDGLSDGNFDEKSGTFSEGIRRIVACSDLENGEELLRECIQKNVIDASPASDDTSVIIISLNIEERSSVDNYSSNKKNDDNSCEKVCESRNCVSNDIVEPNTGISSENICCTSVTKDENKANKKVKLSSFLIASFILIIGVVIGSILTVFKSNTETPSSENKSFAETSTSKNVSLTENNEPKDYEKYYCSLENEKRKDIKKDISKKLDNLIKDNNDGLIICMYTDEGQAKCFIVDKNNLDALVENAVKHNPLELKAYLEANNSAEKSNGFEEMKSRMDELFNKQNYKIKYDTYRENDKTDCFLRIITVTSKSIDDIAKANFNQKQNLLYSECVGEKDLETNRFDTTTINH